MKKYLTNAISPKMLNIGVEATLKRISLAEASELAKDAIDAISHEITAPIVGVLIDKEVQFNRINITLNKGDVVVAVIPMFRADSAREFTKE